MKGMQKTMKATSPDSPFKKQMTKKTVFFNTEKNLGDKMTASKRLV